MTVDQVRVRQAVVGRSVELGALADALDGALRGFGRVVVLEGEAGIGKTRLVQEITATAGAAGAEVCAAAVDAVERRRPFGVLTDALGLTTATPTDPDRDAVAGLLHEADPSGAVLGGLEFRVSEAAVDLVERLCGRGPVLMVLEDLHWADPATLTCLARLGRIADQLPLLLLLTARSVPRGPELARLLDNLADRGTTSIPVGPLGVAEVPVLVEATVGVRPGPNLSRQIERAGGNPLLVIEMLAALTGSGALAAGGDTAEIDTAAAPAVPSLTILHRLSFLPPATLDVLGMASVLGSTFTVTDLCLLSARPAAELAGPLREAIAAGALAERGDRLGFRHELIRDALYTDLPRSLRDALHRDFARALAAAGHAPGRIAEHLLRGAAPGDAEAVQWLRRAADDAGSRAPAVAVELLDHALRLCDSLDPQRGPLAADRAVALMLAGRGREGEAACRDVLARRDDPAREGALRWLLLRTMLIRGRAAEALDHIDAALGLRTATAAEQAHYLAAASFARLALGQVDAAVQLAEQAIETAAPTGDALAVSESLHAKAQVLSVQGRLTEAADLAVRAARELDADVALRGPQTATVTAGMMLVAVDRADEGRALLLRGRRLNESLGAKSGLALHHVMLANTHFLVGEWDDAESEIEASTQLTGDGGPAWPVMTLGILAVIAVHRDELAAAQAHLAAARTALAAGAAPMRSYRMLLAGALLAEASGRGEEALGMLDAGWDRLAAAGVGLAFPEVGPELVRRLVAAGGRAKAEEVTASVEECAARNAGVPNVEGAALVCRGLLDVEPDGLLAAVGAWRDGAQPLGRALACEDAAASLASSGRDDEARAVLNEARGLYGGLGAHRGSARTTAALRRLGVRRGNRGPRPRAATGWDALTATELKVVGLVAERASNPEIAERMYLSKRTVETHVSHALAKLGLRSRLELAAEAARRGGQLS